MDAMLRRVSRWGKPSNCSASKVVASFAHE
jgi:hypothetical protein